jgi:hypothetical protein
MISCGRISGRYRKGSGPAPMAKNTMKDRMQASEAVPTRALGAADRQGGTKVAVEAHNFDKATTAAPGEQYQAW